MFIHSNLVTQRNINQESSETQTGHQNKQFMHGFNPEEKKKEDMALHLHMKNRKKYTHLYKLEKYFK